LALCRELGDPLNESRVLARLADSLWHLGDYEAARTIAEEGLAVSREIGDRRAEAIQTNNLAGLAMAQEDPQTAIVYYRQALAIVESLNDLQGVAVYQNNIGGAYIGLGDFDSALEYLEKAIKTSREAGIPRTQAQAHHTRGRAYQFAKEHRAARAEFEQALSLREELGQSFQTLLTLIQLVHSCTELVDFEAAEKYHHSAVTLYISLQDQIPQYVHQMFHYAVYLYYLAQDNETAAAEHLHLAHHALQNRLAELDDESRAELAQSEDSQLILNAIANLSPP
jgi:tetratricopeptide (TPR) repeat protein